MTIARSIIHVDMDAFYASVEQLDDPSLKGKPVVVGGTPGQRGVVAAASYESREFGIRSAIPTSQALRLCPHLIVLPVRMSRYIEVSKVIHRIFHDFTPDVEKLSIDEAFLDVTGCLRLFGDAETIGRKIKAEIKSQTGLTASVGIAPNKFLAKLASDLEKPDGFTVITEENKQQILDGLAVSKIWGIGKVATKSLHNIGIQTVKQLRTTPLATLKMIFKNHAEDIFQLARGMDDRPVVPYTDAKSVSAEQTFSTDIQNADVLSGILMHQVEEVAQRLRAENWQGRTITLKFRYGNFKTLTRSVTLDSPTNATQILLREAGRVFGKWHEKSAGPLRLLGFGVSGLSRPGTGQQLLFTDPEEEKQKDVDSVFDKIRRKYGDDSLRRGE